MKEKWAITRGIKKKKPEIKLSKGKKSYNTWKDFCIKTTKSLVKNNSWYLDADYFISNYTNALERKLPRGIKQDPFEYPLYKSFGYFFALKELLHMMSNHTYPDYYDLKFYNESFAELVDLLSNNLIYYIDECQMGSDLTTDPPLKPLEGLGDRNIELRELFINETQSNDYVINYLDARWRAYIWIWLLSTPNLREKEISRLKTLPEEAGSKELILHLCSMDMDDEQITALINDYTEESYAGMSDILDASTSTDRLLFSEAIIEWVLRNIRPEVDQDLDVTTRRWVSTFCDKVELYSIRMGHNTDLFEKVVVNFMPYTAHAYAKILFNNGDYRKWTELQTIYCNTPLYYRHDEVKVLWNEAPEYLLPHYHNLIIDEIEGKNRKSYIQAAKLLKELRTIYKKLEKNEAWEDYIFYIQEDYKRLRAFQAELREEKIIESDAD